MPFSKPGVAPIDLEAIYKRQGGEAELGRQDPVKFVRPFSDPRDVEVAGFLASQFAYGNIKAMERFLEGLFGTLGPRPAAFIARGDFDAFRHSYYRFQKGDEIVALLSALRRINEEFGGLGDLFRASFRGDTREALWTIRSVLFGGRDDLIFFFPRPSQANPLKRWNLFLRWMVRKDRIDLGIWDFILPRELVVPLDTHLYRIGRCMGWTARRSPTWKAAREITDALRGYCPDDPLKYDFFLCHRVGIQGGCRGERDAACEGKCVLLEGSG